MTADTEMSVGGIEGWFAAVGSEKAGILGEASGALLALE